MAKCEACKKKASVLYVSPDSPDVQKAVCKSCYEKAHKAVYPDVDVPDLPEDEDITEVENHLEDDERRRDKGAKTNTAPHQPATAVSG